MLVTCPKSSHPLADAVWIDLLNPTDEERAQVEEATQLRMPTRAALEEIESSSRAFVEGSALYLSTPVLAGLDCRSGDISTVGLLLTKKRLVTLRFGDIAAFTDVTRAAGVERLAANEIFLKLLEAMVDRTADALERTSLDLEGISSAAFHADQQPRKMSRNSAALNNLLRRLGRMGDQASRARDALLGVGRIAGFVLEADKEHRLESGTQRLQAIRTDITSLSDYHGHLFGKIQFLLDATLGFINIQQNDIVKALTIVSVVGVPPVLIAGIYGMNFKYMPELGWSFGYPFALLLILVSGLAPLAWFKWRGWI
ncbi:MAG TPA: magnesium transporter CorA family protein [Polyangiaceae bacterium]|nr:magnesium transporter CorA family protein [Polyangiaceae bacterium]